MHERLPNAVETCDASNKTSATPILKLLRHRGDAVGDASAMLHYDSGRDQQSYNFWTLC